MSILATIILTASYFLFGSSEHARVQPIATKSVTVDHTGSDSQTNAPSTPIERLESIGTKHTSSSRIEKDETKPSKRPNTTFDLARLETFKHRPIDLAAFTVKEITPDKFASLGIRPYIEDEFIYYHNWTKVGFPVFSSIHSFDDMRDDSLRTMLGDRPFYAEYATDRRGYMMMHYISKKINGGNSVSLGFYDRDLNEELKKLDYYGLPNVYQSGDADSLKDFSYFKLIIKQGIIRIDTTLSGRFADLPLLEKRAKAVIAYARMLDSTTKAKFGGMREIAKNLPFDFADSTSALVKRVSTAFAKIPTNGRSQLEIIAAKNDVTYNIMDAEKPVENKLRLEQLLIKLAYDAYIEQSKLEAAALENPVDLVPVLVRESSGMKENPRFDNGLILWYRDSDTLREILGMPKASIELAADPKIKMSVMPNPAMLYLYVNYTTEIATPLRVTLADITGKSVYTDAWMSSAGSGKKEINVQQIPNGIYVLVLDSEKGRTTRQVIIQHQ